MHQGRSHSWGKDSDLFPLYPWLFKCGEYYHGHIEKSQLPRVYSQVRLSRWSILELLVFVEISPYKYSYGVMHLRLYQMFLAIEKTIASEVEWERDEGRRDSVKQIILQSWPKYQGRKENGLNEPSSSSSSLFCLIFINWFTGPNITVFSQLWLTTSYLCNINKWCNV